MAASEVCCCMCVWVQTRHLFVVELWFIILCVVADSSLMSIDHLLWQHWHLRHVHIVAAAVVATDLLLTISIFHTNCTSILTHRHIECHATDSDNPLSSASKL